MGLKVRIITPKGKYLSSEVEILNLKTTVGYLGVMQGHLPLIAIIDTAPLLIRVNGEEKHYAISGGVLNITTREALILANTIESKDEIDLDRANNALERATKRLENKDNPEIDVKRAELALTRAITRIKVKEL